MSDNPSDPNNPTPNSPSPNDGDKSADWLAGITDPSHKALVEAKGFKSPADVVQSLAHAQSLLGVKDRESLLRMPATPRGEDPEAWKAFDAARGVPSAPDGYSFDLPDDAGVEINSPAFKHALEGFHRIGLTQDEASGVLTLLLENQKEFGAPGIESAQSEADAAFEKEIETGTAELKAQWGGKFDENVQTAEAALANVPEADGLVSLMKDADLTRHPAWLKFGHELAKLFAEAGAPVRVDGQNQQGSVDAVQAKLAAFEANETKMTAWRNGEPAAVKEFNDLHMQLARASGVQ